MGRKVRRNVKVCARCGARLPMSKPRVYSTQTGLYYCVSTHACAKRARRRKREEEAKAYGAA